ncbi:hypothetical protein ONA91_25215 [Micromonospora sp. DR5-3]|uniref:Kelch repeat-containing protein n=1 Tax=unclassified Micromonospora TaxID=2617518 RepID=UPI0021053DF9|nr:MULTISPECIES: kelch repeat-containing protein [unclassified Micromonospora]MCW3817757.1 hypothetical protein [Micromonospora sp. DR5-3]
MDHRGTGQVWQFTNPGNRRNLTGGGGNFAIIDSDKYGGSGNQDTSLVSQVVNLSDVAAPVVRFNQDFRRWQTERADVDLSLDGGTTWTNVLRQTAGFRGPRVTEVPIPQAAGKDQVQVRFHYYDAYWGYWWQVDNVLIGSQAFCQPTDGGLVLGHVQDKNDNSYINGATVTSDDRPAETGTTVATPDDPELPNGFVWMFSSLTGSHKFTAKARRYVSQSKEIDVQKNGATTATFQLPAGRLSVEPTEVSGTAKMPGGTVNKTFTVTNTGGAPVDVQFSERNGGFELLRADGSTMSEQQLLASTGAPVQRLNVPTSLAALPAGKEATANSAPITPQAAPWANIAAYPAKVMDNRVVNLDGKIYSIAGSNGSAFSAKNYVYDPMAQQWAPIADLPSPRTAMTVGVVDGKIIATGGWGANGPDGATWSYDPAANTWTTVANNPAPRAQAGQAVVGGKLYAIGGCATSSCEPMSNSVVRYDARSDTWETVANYPRWVGYLSCGGIGGVVYCTGGNDGSASQKAGYAYDPGADTWTAIADAPVAAWGSSSAVANGKLMVVGGVQGEGITNVGFAYDPRANSWLNLPNANAARYRGGAACGLYRIGGSTGNFTATPDSEVLPGFEECAEAEDVSWITIDKTSATLAPGEKVTVTVRMTANVDQPGAYSGSILINGNVPYRLQPVQVTMNAQPPVTWGKLMGTVTGTSCQGVSSPLKGATVQVDSKTGSWTFTTDAQGKYAYWLDRKHNPLKMAVAKDGWKPSQTRQTSISSTPRVEDFALSPTRC